MNLHTNFPILHLKNEADKPLIYLDNAATTQVAKDFAGRLKCATLSWEEVKDFLMKL